LDACPLSSTNLPSTNETAALNSSFCCHVTKLQDEIETETSQLDRILQELRDYYTMVKTKRQLGFEVPAGFSRTSEHEKLFCPHLLSVKHSSDTILPQDTLLADSTSDFSHKDLSSLSLSHPDNLESSQAPIITDTDQSSPSIVQPIIRSVD
jgi:hypothetical protein